MVYEPWRLSPKSTAAVQASDNQLFLSVASVWEAIVKFQTGKLKLTGGPELFFEKHLRALDVSVLPIEMKHALEVRNLERHHKDPFDRLLIAQSRSQDWPIVSTDKMFEKYDVNRIW